MERGFRLIEFTLPQVRHGECRIGFPEFMVRAYLPLDLDGPARLGDRIGGAGQRDELGVVGLDVGQPQDAAGGTVASRGLVVKVAASGADIEGEPAGEVAQPRDVTTELGLSR